MKLGNIFSRFLSPQTVANTELFRSTIFALIVRSLGALSILGFNYLIALRLNKDAAGYFFWVFSGLTILVQLSLLGLHDVAMKKIAQILDSERRNLARHFSFRILGWVFISTFTVGVATFIFSGYIAKFAFTNTAASIQLKELIQWMSTALIFSGLAQISAFLLQGAGRPLKAIFSLSIGPYLFFCIFFILSPATTALNCAQLFLFASISNLCVTLSWLIFALPPPLALKDPVRHEIWNMARPMWVIAMMAVSVNWGGQFIAGFLLSASEVAQYAVALRIAMLINFALVAMSFVVAPKIAQLHAKGDIVALQKYTTSSIQILYALGIPIIGGIALFSNQIMSIFGTSYALGGSMLLILGIGQVVNLITGPVGYLLTMTGHERDMRNMYLFSGITCIALIPLLTMRLGPIGTAIATSIALVIQNLGAALMVKIRLGISISPIGRTVSFNNL